LQYASAPLLQITKPSENMIVKTNEIEVEGKTDPAATLTLNDQNVQTDESGKFSLKAPLSLGLNTLTFKATNKFSKTTTKVRHLRLEGQ
jgi:hypothetical protein